VLPRLYVCDGLHGTDRERLSNIRLTPALCDCCLSAQRSDGAMLHPRCSTPPCCCCCRSFTQCTELHCLAAAAAAAAAQVRIEDDSVTPEDIQCAVHMALFNSERARSKRLRQEEFPGNC
jgi:hypothetical protein